MYFHLQMAHMYHKYNSSTLKLAKQCIYKDMSSDNYFLSVYYQDSAKLLQSSIDREK